VGNYATEEGAKDAAEEWADDRRERAIDDMAEVEWEERWDDVKPSWFASWYNEQNGESLDFEIKKETEAGSFEIYEEGEPWSEGEGHFNSLPEAKNAVERYLLNSIEAMTEFNEGEAIRESEPTPTEPKHAGDRLNLPGGKNYREVLLTLPAKPTWREEILERWNAFQKEMLEKYGTGWAQKDNRLKMEEKHLKMLRYFEAQDDRWRGDVSKRQDDKRAIFTHPHWEGVKNTIVHIRFDERIDADGNRIMFLQEVQSDWHQKGRKQGYRKKRLNEDEISARKVALRDRAEAGNTTLADQEEMNNLVRGEGGGVPDAPFKSTKSWQLLAMKRMVRYAAENGFDRIAWTPGAVQNKRYSLSRKVSKIEIYGRTDADGKPTGRGVGIILKEGPTYSIDLGVNDKGIIDNTSYGDFKGKPLADVVGKEVAKKIMDTKILPLTPDRPRWQATIEGLDLDIGGEKMVKFYDKMLPNNLNKFFGTAVWGKARVRLHKSRRIARPKMSSKTRR